MPSASIFLVWIEKKRTRRDAALRKRWRIFETRLSKCATVNALCYISFTGNYTYTKCGPNMVRPEIDNIRYEPIDTASDCVWNINGYMTFVQTAAGTAVVYTGTENLLGTIENGDSHRDPFCNDSFDYGDGVNHFQNTDHHPGGSRNFSLNYLFTMEGAQH